MGEIIIRHGKTYPIACTQPCLNLPCATEHCHGYANLNIGFMWEKVEIAMAKTFGRIYFSPCEFAMSSYTKLPHTVQHARIPPFPSRSEGAGTHWRDGHGHQPTTPLLHVVTRRDVDVDPMVGGRAVRLLPHEDIHRFSSPPRFASGSTLSTP